MTTDAALAHHLNFVRQNLTSGDVRRIPDVAYAVYNKNAEAPQTSEGFAEVRDVAFAPRFESDRHRELFMQWT